MDIKIRYLTTRRGRKGQLRYYWQPSPELRKVGWTTQSLGQEQAAAFARAQQLNLDLDAYYAGLKERPVTADHGSVNALIIDYKKGWRFLELKQKTKDSYEYCFRILRRTIGDFPVVAVTPPMVQKIYAGMKAETPGKASAVIRVLRLLLEHARRAGWVMINAAQKPGISTAAKKGLLWSTAAIDAFVEAADQMGYFTIGTTIMLNEWLGQRKGDVLLFSRANYRDGRIYVTQSKRGAEVALPIDMVPQHKARLDAQQARNDAMAVKSIYLFPTEFGLPYSESWFGYLFRCIRDKAAANHPELPELKDLIFKDLRHTAVTRLAEAGCEIPMIASITGHSFRTCQDIIDRYNIRTTKMATEAFRRRLAATTSLTAT